jgi:polar amino acid transport system substrate-binding protein
MRNLFEVSDAIGIAAFTVTGVAVAIAHKAEPVWLWAPLLAMLTAAGGGILRDVLRQSGDIKSLRSEFYAEVPLIWGLLLALYLHWQALHLGPDDFVTAVVVTMAGAFLTRMAAVTLKMKSPAFA